MQEVAVAMATGTGAAAVGGDAKREPIYNQEVCPATIERTANAKR